MLISIMVCMLSRKAVVAQQRTLLENRAFEQFEAG